MTDDGEEEVTEDAETTSSLLYDDVDAASFSPSSLLAVKHAYELQQLRSELAEARGLQQAAAAEVERKEAECARYRAQCAVLARNVSLLYATAVSEVRRKNEEIDRLQAWKEAKERRDRQRRQDDQQQQQQHQPTAATPPQPLAPPSLLPLSQPPPRLAVTPLNSLPRPPPVSSSPRSQQAALTQSL